MGGYIFAELPTWEMVILKYGTELEVRSLYSDPSRRRSMTAAILSPNHNKIWCFLEKG